jgi:hypothetical protein
MTGRYRKLDFICWMTMVASLGAGDLRAQGPVEYPGPTPGKAEASVENKIIFLSNDILRYACGSPDGYLLPHYYIRIKGNPDLELEIMGELFYLLLVDKGAMANLGASQLRLVQGPQVEDLPPTPQAQRPGARAGGKRVRASLTTPDTNLSVQWSVELRDGSNYVPCAAENRCGSSRHRPRTHARRNASGHPRRLPDHHGEACCHRPLLLSGV